MIGHRVFGVGVSRRRSLGTIGLLLLGLLPAAWPAPARATVSIGAWMSFSEDDISGFTTLSGNDTTATPTMPFSVTIEGVTYSTVTISTNGWMEFGGNTQGTSDASNACLPTSKHTNPFLAFYWDDMQTQVDNIRYGTSGTSPNRTFVVDFQLNRVASSGDEVNGQVQVHERSNVINVRYRGPIDAAANGQAATIGFQGAGGSSGVARPLTCNGKILDDNNPDEGWSVAAGTAGLLPLFAIMEHSPDDISGFTTLSGDNAIAGVTMPFSVTIEGTSYSTVTIGTNGLLQFGTTTGANPTSNAALPSASFPNPTLFWYWDDLQTEGGNIRYGTVGSSPNRTFIVDFQENRVAATGDKVNGQVQIHERSNLFNVKYRSTLSAGANGQTATIGFQGGGGSSAVGYPLTFNGKILDDDRPDDGWSAFALPLGAMVVHAVNEFSPNDISGFTTLSGDNAIAGVTMPFSIKIDGTNYSTVTIGTNGLIQFGTTTGANPTANAALPSSSFPNPTLFYYWDDLQTEGSNIQYGTVGTSPNRTFIVDFQENLVASSGDKVNGQVQIHERSNVIDVRYRSTMSGNANGQSATIGFQGAGGSSATGYPLTFNGKILDDNRPNSGWSVSPLPICGNSIVETQEDCDQGAANGTSTSCCTSTCAFRASGQSCRTAAGICDAVETCTGTSATCPSDTFLSSSTVCRASAGICDTAESCTGTSTACPADGFVSSTTVCRASAGICDTAESCTGTSAACPDDAFVPASTICRGSAGICDTAETCTGTSAACPADAFVSSTTVCRASAGICDAAETCTGTSAACPIDAFVSPTTVCRAAAGVCDTAESCTGTSAPCPADALAGSGTPCTSDGNPCTLDECDGTSVACQHPAGNAGATCRAAAGACDPAETCTGTSTTCPPDVLSSAGTECRAAAGVCDVAETCTGTSAACPADAFEASTTVCRAAAGTCDLAEQCTGTSAACPTDAKSTDVCRAATGDCDAAESCDGSSDDCPPDVVEPSTVECRASEGACDPAESCTGTDAACPADAKSTAECRPAAGVCDVAESCDGVGNDCPPDTFEPATTVCRAAGGVCDVDETCTGSSAACPVDAKSTAECRASQGACDLAESCDGLDDDCPADLKSTAECRPAAGVCDQAESCDGTNDACPLDQKSTAECRPAAGACDLAESCNGVGDDCPADQKSTAECRASQGVCDPAESCDGTSDDCPADGKSTAVCRSAAGVCDVTESCDGTNADCPFDAKSTDECRPSAGICDPAETCDGVGDDCPADQKSTAECRAAAGVCDLAESCDGTNDDCPADLKSTAECRPTAGVCDLAESCDGVGNDCPPDQKSTAECRASQGVCDPAESCDGVGNDCPADAKSTAECRASQGVCDPAESCDGIGNDCPPDVKSGAECRAAAGDCDVAESCDGVGNACPPDGFAAATVTCRAATGACDVAEQCTGTSAACPPDAVQPASFACRPAAGPCDTPEQCDGTSGSCPADAFAPATVVCRPAAGTCDLAESCPGTGPDCPADQKSTAICRTAAGACDVAESCDGSSDSCPADALAPVGTVCRAAVGTCDVAELCDGLTPACPADLTLPDGAPCTDDNICTTDACAGGVCVGTPPANGCADHYLCYKVKPAAPFTPIPNVHLVDQFEDITVNVTKVRSLCPPADKNGEGVTDDVTHLESYAMKAVSGTTPFAHRTNIQLANQFGSLVVDAVKRDLLLVPTGKSLVGPTAPPDLPSINVDHYKCYKAKTSAGTTKFAPTTVTVTDQFIGATPKTFVLKKLKHLCNPVEKNGEQRKNPDTHLACYQAKPARGEPKHVRRTGVNTNNQFGPLVLGTIKESELCVPSLTTVGP